LAIDPNLVIARNWGGWGGLYLGRIEAAIDHFSVALKLSPLDPRSFLPQTGLAYAHLLAGRNEEALLWATRAIQSQPNFPGGHRVKLASLAMMGRTDEARRIRDAVMKVDPLFRISDLVNRFRRFEDVERLQQAFRLAGMPE
jgi:tetratricopeptide (TPR) repeat protein